MISYSYLYFQATKVLLGTSLHFEIFLLMFTSLVSTSVWLKAFVIWKSYLNQNSHALFSSVSLLVDWFILCILNEAFSVAGLDSSVCLLWTGPGLPSSNHSSITLFNRQSISRSSLTPHVVVFGKPVACNVSLLPWFEFLNLWNKFLIDF